MVIAGRRGHKGGSPDELFSNFRGEFRERSVTRADRRPPRPRDGPGTDTESLASEDVRTAVEGGAAPGPPVGNDVARGRGCTAAAAETAKGEVDLRGHGCNVRPTETNRTTTRRGEGEGEGERDPPTADKAAGLTVAALRRRRGRGRRRRRWGAAGCIALMLTILFVIILLFINSPVIPAA